MAEVVDNRFIGDVVYALHAIIRLGRIGLLLRVSEVDALQNTDATRRHSPRNAHYQKSLRNNPVSGVPALCSCAGLPLQRIPSSASFQTHQTSDCYFVDRFVLDRFLFRFFSHALAYCEWNEPSFGRDLGCGIPRNGGNGGRNRGCFG